MATTNTATTNSVGDAVDGKPVEKKESRARRDLLRSMEPWAQKKWKEDACFVADAPVGVGAADDRNKYFGTFPYPYMNGRLHVGHVFSLSKLEFAAQFERMRGKHVLFPFAFHVTGMPIQACANKLKQELEMKANGVEVTQKDNSVAEEERVDPTKFVAKKAKVQQKAGAGSQSAIMRSIGVPEEKIPEFADANTWLEYFPPLAVQDLTQLGLSADWRRSFITTDKNPYYDSFIRWQFETLRSQNKIQFGKRYAVFSPLDNQPCADHDRASGEGAQPQEYTLIKLRCVEPLNQDLAAIVNGSRPCFFIAATLRPETMYGQTNCWALPSGEYGVYELKGGKELVVCAERAALNMSYQDITEGKPGEPVCIGTVMGSSLIGQACSAPNTVASWDHIYTLPLLSISMEKGTGLVTSVPSDAPDDWAALRDWQQKEGFREKFGVKEEWCVPYDPVPIIHTDEFGDLAAVTVCDQMKIKSQKDAALLTEAKLKVYKSGFYDGVLTVGPYSGQKVLAVKDRIKAEMIAAGDAIKYAEPERKVVARSGCECVVAHTDQWYLVYGEETWREEVREHILQMETYNEAHLLQGDMTGQSCGSLDIAPEQMTSKVWDHVFRGGEYPAGETDIPQDKLKLMIDEFNYWYPLEIRVSGKDLIQNHLIFWLYNHIAMFPKDKWPRGVRTNGHVLINSEKMSKSTGNFLTLYDSLSEYGADATRFALADAGDGLDDANFVADTANMCILRLTSQLEWFNKMMETDLRVGPLNMLDEVFMSAINTAIRDCTAAYDRMLYHTALVSGFFELQAKRDVYRSQLCSVPLHSEVVRRFIEVQTLLLSPICPHFAEHVWSTVLGNDGDVVIAPWPEVGPINDALMRASQFVEETVFSLRSKVMGLLKPKKGKKASEPALPTTCHIYIAKHYPEWQARVIEIIREGVVDGKEFDMSVLVAALKSDNVLKPYKKHVMKYAAFVREDHKKRGAFALDLEVPFDQSATLNNVMDYLNGTLVDAFRDKRIEHSLQISIIDRDDVPEGVQVNDKSIDASSPGKAIVYLR